jgi:uncharacterized protein
MKWRTKSSIAASISVAAFLLPALLAPAALPCAMVDAGEERPAAEKARPIKDYSPFPNPDSGYVTDIADVLTDDEEERIERWLWQTESRMSVEIIVVTISAMKDYPGTPNASIEQFATGLFNAYGIGNMPKNDGVLLVVSVKDRKARIELGAHYGSGRDADARRIMDRQIVPYCAKGDYAAAITNGVKAIMLEFAGLRVGWNWPLIIVLISIPVVAIVAYSLFKSGKRGWGWVFVGLLIVLVMAAVWIIVQTLRHMPRSHSSGWSAGGIGGFGGGFSGGGGATGSW